MRDSGDDMANKSEVLLTASDLLKWREEDKELDEKIRQLQQRRSDLKRKLDAAEVFADALATGPVSGLLSQANGHDSEEPSESPAVALCENLRKTGESLKVQQIKARLIELGFGAKIEVQPNYTYTLVYRLSKSGKLLKRGSRYRAPPDSSPEGETEAVGASVRH